MGERGASGGEDFEGDGVGESGEEDGGGVLAAVAAAGVDLVAGSGGKGGLTGVDDTDGSADAMGIAGGAAEAEGEAGLGGLVAVEFGIGGVLGEGEIGATVGVEIGDGAAALFAVGEDAGGGAGEGLKPALAVAKEEQAAAGVLAGDGGADGEEVLGEEEVEVPVEIEVGDIDPEHRSELGFGGERDGFEVVPAVEEKHGGKGGGFEDAGSELSMVQEGGDGGLGEGGVGGVAFLEPGELAGQDGEIALGSPVLEGGLEGGLDEVHVALSGEIAVVEADGMLGGGTVPGIEAPITDHEVGEAIVVEVTGVDAGPPTGEGRQAPVGGGLAKDAAVVVEDADGTPFAGEGEFWEAVEVEIGEKGAGDETGVGEFVGEVGIGNPGVLMTVEQLGRGGFGVTAGDRGAADEEFEGAVAIDIGEGEGAGGGGVEVEEGSGVAGGVVGDELCVGGGGGCFVGGGHDGEGGSAVREGQDGGRFEGGRGRFDEEESALGIVEEDAGATALAGGDGEVVEAIAVEVEPGDAGT